MRINAIEDITTHNDLREFSRSIDGLTFLDRLHDFEIRQAEDWHFVRVPIEHDEVCLSVLLQFRHNAGDVIVRVEITLDREPPELSFIRHVHNHNSIFDASSDTTLQLPQNQVDAIRSNVQQVFGTIDNKGPALQSITLSIYPDGQWSSGGTMKTARSKKRATGDNGND